MQTRYKQARNGDRYYYGGMYNEEMGLRAWLTRRDAYKSVVDALERAKATRDEFVKLGCDPEWWEYEINKLKKELKDVSRS